MVVTFLPYPDFIKCAKVLDVKRLMKQRVEAYQIIRCLQGITQGYKNHPAVKMWVGHTETLKLYFNCMIEEVYRRGYKNNIPMYKINRKKITCPWWLGYSTFHNSHKARLLQKNKDWYKKKFTVKQEYLSQGYIWPTKLSEKQQENIMNYMAGKIKKNPYRIEDVSEVSKD